MTTLRLRLVFLALALVLALPAALLVRRALASVALERDARERAVAERAFDEMERALTELLRREEQRPASDYDFARGDSPLREPQPGDIARGWFQIEADGSASAPTWAPDAASLAQRIAAEGARLEGVVRARQRAKTARAKPTREAAAPKAPPVSPSATVALPRPESLTVEPEPGAVPIEGMQPSGDPLRDALGEGAPVLEGGDLAGRAPTPATDAFDALAKLNTGAREREERKQRVYVEQQASSEPEGAGLRRELGATSIGSFGSAPTESVRAPAEASRESMEAIVARAMAAEPSAAETPSELGALEEADAAAPRASDATADAAPEAPVPSAAPARNDASREVAAAAGFEVAPAEDAPLASARAASEPEPTETELVRVVVDPMRGRLGRDGELLLVRSAWIGDRGVRQGVVLDVRALERALEGATLATGALPGARVELAPARQLAGPAGAAEGMRVFTHRFAEPFDPLAVALSIAAFPDDGARSVYWLAALFAIAGAGGLYAIYRMSAVALHFAERRSNFAAAVSHELKTPLTAIRLYAEMLRDGLVSGEAKRSEYYGSITAETERLSRLINNVLEFSRLEKGARTLELQVGDPAPVVREAVDLLRGHAAQHGFALALHVDDGLPPVRFERDALVQVVFNLVDNAIKYGRGEPARIEVSCARAGAGVEVRVRDHGAGVPREELGRILEPFYRRGDELTRSAQGAGIGLSLVRSLAQQMGAALRVANAEDGGLVASIELAA